MGTNGITANSGGGRRGPEDITGGNTNGRKQMEYYVALGANGGSNFIDETYFVSDRENKSGLNDGDGYIMITKL